MQDFQAHGGMIQMLELSSSYIEREFQKSSLRKNNQHFK